jgi:HD-GYP domain-containing protein (c-di-GMP phosphodiesterase class II)
MMDAQQGSILLLDERTGKLTLRARSIRCEQLGDTPGASTTVASRCFARKESLLCNDVRCHPDLPTPSGNAGAMSSIICALLRTSHKILGVLHLDRSASQKPYALEDLHMADGIAAAMATTIASAQAIQEKRRNIFLQTVITLTHSLALRDAYTSGHAQRVTEYVLLLADELKLPSAERQCLQLAGPLHDIGKLGVEDAVLRKQDCLTPEEFDQMKSHPTKGVALLESIPDMAPILPIVRSHHERWDGQGYPDGLAGEQIPRLARMIAVADVFDVLTFDTPYRRSTSLEHAFAALQEGAGSQFDPECVDAFAQARPRLERCLHRSDKDIYRSVGSGI